MEKKRLIVTALVLVAAIAITLFLTKGYWWPFVYYHCEQPCLPLDWEPQFDMPLYSQTKGSYLEKFFTAQTAPSEYPESWLIDKDLLNGYSRFYYTYQVAYNVSVEGPNNGTVLKIYVFKYKTQEIAKNIYEKGGLETIKSFGYTFAEIKHKPNVYVFQSNRFIVYMSGSEDVSKNAMNRLLLAHYGE